MPFNTMMKHIGQTIRSLRKQRRMTILDVSKATGIDIASLSRMENGKMTGTVQSHVEIGRALGVPLPALYEKAFEFEFGEKVSKRTRTDVYGPSGNISSENLSGHGMDKKMSPIRLKLKASTQTDSENFTLGTERFVYVLKGEIQVSLKGQTHKIQANQSLYFNASLPHHFVNQTKRESACLIITSSVPSEAKS